VAAFEAEKLVVGHIMTMTVVMRIIDQVKAAAAQQAVTIANVAQTAV
jgi:hypothetical protein